MHRVLKQDEVVIIFINNDIVNLTSNLVSVLIVLTIV